MLRNLTGVAIVLVTLACEQAPQGDVLRAGVFTTVGAPRTWRLEAPPPDTIQTVTRRIWYDPEADGLGAPSPDGTQLVYHDWPTGAIAIRDLETGESRRITQFVAPYYPGFAMFPKISADGSQVAYAWNEMDKPFSWQLRVVGIEDPEPRVLHTAEPWMHPGDWSPDGTQIVALRSAQDGTHQIILVSTLDGTTRVIKQSDWRVPWSMRFSPDGRYVLYEWPTDLENEESRDLFLIPLDGGPEVRLVEHAADDKVLGWTPDGAHVLFQSDRTGTPGAWLLSVVEGRAKGAPQLVKPDFWRANPMGFSNDGRFFYGVESSSRSIRVATLNPETGELVGRPDPGNTRSGGRQLWVSWSPDSRNLAFLLQASNANSPRTLAIRSQETGEERHLRLPMDLQYPAQPTWHPDGQSILIRSSNRENQPGLYRVDIRTGEFETVFKLPVWTMNNTFDVFPDGESIVYSVESKAEDGRSEFGVVVRDLSTGIEREILSEDGGGTVTQFRQVRVSPDGNTVALWQVDRDDSAILLLPADGGEAREIYRGVVARQDWMPDGRHLLVRIRDTKESFGTHLVRVAVETGEIQDLGFSMEGAGPMDLSPDGRLLAYLDGASAAEVWVMEFMPVRQ